MNLLNKKNDLGDEGEKSINLTHLIDNKLFYSAIKILTTKTSSDQSNSEISIINQFYSSLDYFQNIPNLSNDLFRKISVCLNIKQFDENQYVYLSGDKAKYFYIILKGSVSVLMQSNNNIDKDEESLYFQEILRLSQGKGFGQFSILYKQDREASVKCLEKTVLGMISNDDYHVLLEIYEREKICNTIDFLKKIKFFNEFSTLEMEKFHFYLEKRVFSKGQIVYSTDDIVDGIYLIQNGSFNFSKVFKNDVYNYINFNREGHNIEENDVFGEHEPLSNIHKRNFSVYSTCNSSSTLFCNKIVFFFITTQYSLTKKIAANNKKFDQINNLYKFKVLCLSKEKKTKTEKIQIIERNMPEIEYVENKNEFETNFMELSKNLDINYYGYAQDARKLGVEFERSLDKLDSKLNRLKMDYMINEVKVETKSLDNSTDGNQCILLKKIFTPNSIKNSNPMRVIGTLSPLITSKFRRSNLKCKTLNGLGDSLKPK